MVIYKYYTNIKKPNIQYDRYFLNIAFRYEHLEIVEYILDTYPDIIINNLLITTNRGGFYNTIEYLCNTCIFFGNRNTPKKKRYQIKYFLN